MEVDYIGANSVANLIEITGLTKFVISRIGQHKNVVPIFEHISAGSNEKAINAFTRWATLTDNSLPYEMNLFNSIEDSEINGEEVRNKKQGKVLRFTFCLVKKQEIDFRQQPQQPQQIDVAMAIENALMKMQAKNNESELIKRLDAMQAKIDAYESEDFEEEDAELNGVGSPNMTQLITLLAPLLSGNKKTAPTTINGLNNDQIGNINRAVKLLAKYDDQIDTDLLKLASIAENSPDTFKMLLGTLRTM